jgi:hypothetical protein
MPDDPFRMSPGTNPPRPVPRSTNTPFIWWAIVVAVLWVVHNRSARDTPNQPAVTTAPPATGTPALAWLVSHGEGLDGGANNTPLRLKVLSPPAIFVFLGEPERS